MYAINGSVSGDAEIDFRPFRGAESGNCALFAKHFVNSVSLSLGLSPQIARLKRF